MKYTVLVLGIVAAIAVVVAAYQIVATRNRVLGENVRDPTHPDNIQDDEIRQMVEVLFLEKLDYLNSKRLRLVGDCSGPESIRQGNWPRPPIGLFL